MYIRVINTIVTKYAQRFLYSQNLQNYSKAPVQLYQPLFASGSVNIVK